LAPKTWFQAIFPRLAKGPLRPYHSFQENKPFPNQNQRLVHLFSLNFERNSGFPGWRPNQTNEQTRAVLLGPLGQIGMGPGFGEIGSGPISLGWGLAGNSRKRGLPGSQGFCQKKGFKFKDYPFYSTRNLTPRF